MGFGDGMLRFVGLGERLTDAMNNNPRPTEADKEKYFEIARWAAQRGYGLTMHWGPDATVDHLLTIFERVNREMPIAPLRWSIAHLNDASPKTLERMQALGVGWTVQDAMYFGGEAFVKQSGPDAARRVPPVVTADRLGVHVGGGTDAHRVASYNPFTSLQWFLDGKTVSGLAMRGPEETPTPPAGAAVLHQGQRLVLARRRRARLDRSGEAGRPRRAVEGLPHRAGRRDRRHRVGV